MNEHIVTLQYLDIIIITISLGVQILKSTRILRFSWNIIYSLHLIYIFVTNNYVWRKKFVFSYFLLLIFLSCCTKNHSNMLSVIFFPTWLSHCSRLYTQRLKKKWNGFYSFKVWRYVSNVNFKNVQNKVAYKIISMKQSCRYS